MRPRALLILPATIIVALSLWLFATRREVILDAVQGSGAWGPVLFVAGYALLTAAFVPAGPLTMLAGALFGVFGGATLAFVGAVAAASISFAAARYLARDRVTRWTARSPRLAGTVQAVARDGRRIVFLMRLSPLIPFNFINVTMGVTGISYRDFVLACIGMAPVSLLYAYYGAVLGAVVALSGQHPSGERGELVALALGLIATLVVTVIISRAARRALEY